MKRLLPLVLLLLLCGCSHPLPESESAPSAPVSTTEPMAVSPEGLSLYAPGHPLEAATGGAISVYPLPGIGCGGVAPLGKDLLVYVLQKDHSSLLRLSGEELAVAGEIMLSGEGNPYFSELRITEDGLSYHDPAGGRTVCLDQSLQLLPEIPDPEGLLGAPLLSRDGTRLFYCTEDALRVLDRTSGISRILAAGWDPARMPKDTLMEDTVLVVESLDPEREPMLQFISTETGMTLWERGAATWVGSQGSRFYCIAPDGAVQSFIFGTGQEEPLELYPRTSGSQVTFLPQVHGAVSASQPEEGTIQLEYYDLASGKRTGAVRLDAEFAPQKICAVDGMVCFVLEGSEGPLLCRWDAAHSAVADSRCYTGLHYTAQNPDREALEICAELARSLGEKYGIQILTWKDAAAREPWDYTLEPEHRADLTLEALEILAAQLEQFPEGFFATLSGSFDTLTLCPVRGIRGSAESGSLEEALGVQFWVGKNAYVALTVGKDLERTFYHELSHIIDTRILGNSSAYDSWEKLNPRDFQYDYDYWKNRQRQGFQGYEEDAFVDLYSMSYPKEDRARILEYAMMPGNESLFQKNMLQRKLLTICTGIREAFALENYPEELPWEQYLLTSLVKP